MTHQEWTNWAKNNIVWKGNENTNRSSRRGYVPRAIIDHINAGSWSSTVSWFRSSGNDGSSAHFLVGRDGRICQFVKIEDNAWHAGIRDDKIKASKTLLVKKMGVNPNWYTVGIEHENLDGNVYGLTDAQLKSTIMLHKYIIAYIQKKYKLWITPDRIHVLGHCEIDPWRKPFCPGSKFPYNEIIKGIKEEKKDVSSIQKLVRELKKDGLVYDEAYWIKFFNGEKAITKETIEYIKIICERAVKKID